MPDLLERPPIASAPISVVLVADNSAHTLTNNLNQWTQFLDSLNRDYEILLVDDGSMDGTATVLAELSPLLARVKILRHDRPQGIGAALRSGIAAARMPLLCYSTADGAYRPAELQRLIEAIDPLDLVTGYRQWRPVPLWFRIPETVYRLLLRVVFGIPTEPQPCWFGRQRYSRRWLARWILGLPVSDPECSFRLFRRALFDRIPIQSAGSFAHIEILAKANFLGALLAQVPVSYHPPPDGERVLERETGESDDIAAVLFHPEFLPARESAAGCPVPEGAAISMESDTADLSSSPAPLSAPMVAGENRNASPPESPPKFNA